MNVCRSNENWTALTLGELCDIYQPKTISTKKMVADGKYVVFGANGIIGRFNEFNHEEPQLLITCRGATCGSVNISHPKSWITGNAMVVRPKSDLLDRDFLKYYFIGICDFSKIITGAAQPQITRQSLAPVKIYFPPLPEQRRIVAILDEAIAGLETMGVNAEKNIQNATDLFESVLNDYLGAKDKGWRENLLADVVHRDCSLSYGIVQPGQDKSEGIPVVRPTDLTTKIVGLKGLKLIDSKLADSYKRTTLVGGELLLCVRGSTGVLSVASKSLIGGNVTRGIVPIRFQENLIIPEFGYYLFKSFNVQQQIRQKTYGAALMQINIGDLRKLLVNYPSIEVQQKIVNQLDAFSEYSQALVMIYEQKLDFLEKLKQSILHKAFSGELTSSDIAA